MRTALGVPGFALVIGGASRIGRAIVQLLTREGYTDIALADINLSKKECITAIVKQTFSTFRRINYTINGNRIIGINITVVFLCLKDAKQIISQESLTTNYVYTPLQCGSFLRYSGAYMAAKHNIARITRIVALDYPEIKYNAIHFGLPEEIPKGVVWLLGYRSNFVYGSCLIMDNGYLTH
ncbi:putative 3-oxoacyl-reductase FabG [Hyaloscypha sp. PMI_1271]|nr:putative 3-oxoacyl-reductase FabG [Hyaloscypha sp. PMI_1271]